MLLSYPLVLPSAGGISQFKKKQKKDSKTQEHDRNGQCPVCNSSFKLYRKLKSGKFHKKLFIHCFECRKKQASQSKSQGADADSN